MSKEVLIIAEGGLSKGVISEDTIDRVIEDNIQGKDSSVVEVDPIKRGEKPTQYINPKAVFIKLSDFGDEQREQEIRNKFARDVKKATEVNGTVHIHTTDGKVVEGAIVSEGNNTFRIAGSKREIQRNEVKESYLSIWEAKR